MLSANSNLDFSGYAYQSKLEALCGLDLVIGRGKEEFHAKYDELLGNANFIYDVWPQVALYYAQRWTWEYFWGQTPEGNFPYGPHPVGADTNLVPKAATEAKASEYTVPTIPSSNKASGDQKKQDTKGESKIHNRKIDSRSQQSHSQRQKNDNTRGKFGNWKKGVRDHQKWQGNSERRNRGREKPQSPGYHSTNADSYGNNGYGKGNASSHGENSYNTQPPYSAYGYPGASSQYSTRSDPSFYYTQPSMPQPQQDNDYGARSFQHPGGFPKFYSATPMPPPNPHANSSTGHSGQPARTPRHWYDEQGRFHRDYYVGSIWHEGWYDRSGEWRGALLNLGGNWQEGWFDSTGVVWHLEAPGYVNSFEFEPPTKNYFATLGVSPISAKFDGLGKIHRNAARHRSMQKSKEYPETEHNFPSLSDINEAYNYLNLSTETFQKHREYWQWKYVAVWDPSREPGSQGVFW